MQYRAFLCVLGVLFAGCAKDLCPRVPKPMVQPMLPVVIEGGVIQGKNVDNVINNMLGMQKMVDELELCPCYDKED